MIHKIIRQTIKILFLILLTLLESVIFLLIKLLPSVIIFELAKKRYKFYFIQNLFIKNRVRIKIFLEKYLFSRVKVFKLATSCLSRSLLSKLVLDLIGVDNKINFSIIKDENGKKRHHSWVNCINLDIFMMGNLNHKVIFTL